MTSPLPGDRLAVPAPEHMAPGEWAVTIDAGPSNDASTDVGYTIRLWRAGNLILSSGSQAYADKAFAEKLVSDLIRPGAPVVLIRRDREHCTTGAERLR